MCYSGYKHSTRTKEKISENNIGFRERKHSEKTKNQIHCTSKMTWSSEELRKKMSERIKLSYLNGKRKRKQSQKKTRNVITGDLLEWKKNVYKKDNYTCAKYKTKGERLNAHHIKNVADNSELILDLDNGITFSERAHREFHKIFGRKNNNKKQLAIFLCS